MLTGQAPGAGPGLSRALGSVLVDADGRRCLDFTAGGGWLNYGHNDPDLAQALVAHLQAQGPAGAIDQRTVAKQAFIKAFSQHALAPGGLGHHRLAFTTPGPDEALALGVRLARRATGRQAVVAFTGSHPAAHAAWAAGTELWRVPYDGALGPAVDTADGLAQALADAAGRGALPAVLLLETVQTQGPLQAARPDWLRRVVQTAQRQGVWVLLDDRATGAGRCGGFFSTEGMGLVPDLVLPAHALTGMGQALGLLLLRQDHDLGRPLDGQGPPRLDHHAFVTATAALQKFWSGEASAHAARLAWARKAALLRAGLDAVAALQPDAEVVGRGLLCGLRLGDEGLADGLHRRCLRHGLLLGRSPGAADLLVASPALTTPTLLLERGLAVLHRCLAELLGLRPRHSPAHRQLASVH